MHSRALLLITVVCVIIGLLVRLEYYIHYPVQPRDSYKYQAFIETWEETGEMPRGHRGALSLWILKSPHLLFKVDTIRGGVIINNCLGILLIMLAIVISKRIFGKNSIALFAGLIVATHPQLVRFSTSFLRENTYLVFAMLTLGFLLEYIRNKRLACVISAGIVSALSFLCRIEGLELTLMTFVMILFLLIQRKIKIKKAFLHSLAFIFVFCFTLAIVCVLLGLKINSIDEIMDMVEVPSGQSVI